MPEPLLTIDLPEPLRLMIPLADLEDTPTSGASNHLLNSMRTCGQRSPVLIEPVPGGLRIRGGKRRVATARKLRWDDIDALVYEGLTEDQWAHVMAADHNRGANPVDEARTFGQLQQTLTLKGIQANTGVPIQTIRARLVLLNLPADVLDLIGTDHLSLGVAEDVAKLKGLHLQQAVAAIRLAAADDQSFTGKHLKEIKVVRTGKLAQLLVQAAPPPVLLMPAEMLLALEVDELCQRRNVSREALLAELQKSTPTLTRQAAG